MSLIKTGRDKFCYLLNRARQNSGLGSGTVQDITFAEAESLNKNRDEKRGFHSCCRTDMELGALPLPAAYTCCFR